VAGSQPLISVLVPCRNAADTIRDTFDSLAAQTFREFEVVALDDGSTDETPRILELIASSWPAVRVVTLRSGGLPNTLNRGIAEARGRWIARLDADDVAVPHRLAAQMRAATRDDRVVLVGSDCQFCDAEMRPIRRFRYPTTHARLVRRMRTCGNSFPHSSALFRRGEALAAGGYRAAFTRAQDLDLWLRLSERGRVVSVSTPLVKIRRHSRQMSHHAGGRESFDLGRVAAMCAELRASGNPDPMEDAGPEADRVIGWVSGRLREMQEVERRRSLAEQLHALRLTKRPMDAIQLLMLLAKEGRGRTGLVAQALLGSSIPRELAREWSARSEA
jgi:hypothetical protein